MSNKLKGKARANARKKAQKATMNNQRSSRVLKAHDCRMFISRTDKKTGEIKMAYADVGIPTKPYGDRDGLLGDLCNDWDGHINQAIQTASAYLSHSSSLMFAKSGMTANVMCNNNGIIDNLDLNNLGCVLEFEVDGREINTQGPQWMSPGDVDKFQFNLRNKLSKDYDLVKETA